MNIGDNNVSILIPTPNTTGVYQGKISLEGDGERKCIPISFSTYRNDEIKINNTRDIYENSKIYGRFEGDAKAAGIQGSIQYIIMVTIWQPSKLHGKILIQISMFISMESLFLIPRRCGNTLQSLQLSFPN